MVLADEVLMRKQWFALHIKCHHEKQVALRLQGKGLEPFLPLRSVQRKWSDRKKVVDFPLFPGYLFVKCSLLEKREVVQTPSVVRMVGNTGPEPIPESQIIAVQRFVESEVQFDPYPYLIPGMSVEVVRGPLKGVIGLLEKKKTMHRLIINLEMINNCVATEIDAVDVQPL